MYPYYFIFAITCSIFLVKKNKHEIALFGILSILSFFCAFRAETVGVDTSYYWSVFDSVAEGKQLYIREPVYIFLVQFVRYIGGNQQIIFLIIGTLTTFLYGRFILRYSSSIPVSLFVFVTMGVFYLSTFNQMRQYFAISMFAAFSIPAIIDKKPLRYYSSVIIIALTGHLSTLFLFPLYGLIGRKVVFFHKVLIAIIFLSLLSSFVYLISLSPYAYFVLRWEDSGRTNALIVMQIVVSLIIMLFEKRTCAVNESMRIFFNMNYVSFLLMLTIKVNSQLPSEMIGRINNYFYIGTLILIPAILDSFEVRSRRILLTVLVILLSLYYFRNIVSKGDDYFLTPYKFNFKMYT